MLYMSKICGYLKILADDEVNDSVSIHFSESIKSTRQKLCSKLKEEQTLRKIAKSPFNNTR